LKAALLPYIKGLARNLAPKNVRANVVSPAAFSSRRDVGHDAAEESRPLPSSAQSPSHRRMATPEEVANAVVFLASPRASFLSGNNLICDGAMTQRVQF